MKNLLGRAAFLDRRVIFALVAVAMAWAVVSPPRLPAGPTAPSVLRLYSFVESLPPRSFVLVCADIDPANAPELLPQAKAVLRHALGRGHRVALVYFSASAAGVAGELADWCAGEFPGKAYGRDFVLLPYMPDFAAALTQMGSDMISFYVRDSRGAPLEDLPVMSGVRRLGDVQLAVVFSATTLLDSWVALAGDRFGFPLAGGVTAVIEPRYGPYLQTGQLCGLSAGLKGAADYEGLLGAPAGGTEGLSALNVVNLLALAFMVLANVLPWLGRRR